MKLLKSEEVQVTQIMKTFEIKVDGKPMEMKLIAGQELWDDVWSTKSFVESSAKRFVERQREMKKGKQ